MSPSSSSQIEAIVQKDYTVRVWEFIGRGWELLKQNIGGFIGYTLLISFISIILSRLNLEYFERGFNLVSLVSVILAGPLNAGFYIVAFKHLRNRPTTFSDFFGGFSNFLPLFLIHLVSSLLITLGFIILIIPGIYLMVAYIFGIPFVVDKHLPFWEAMEASRKLITRHWFNWLGLLLVLGLLNIVGLLCFGIGVFITIPLTLCTLAVAYADIVGLNGNVAGSPTDL